MSSQSTIQLLRGAAHFVLPAAFAFSLAVTPAAMAQVQPEHDFINSSASSDSLTSSSSTEGAAPLPFSPTPAATGDQSERSYGYHENSHNWAKHLTFEAGGGFNAPIGNDGPFITWGGNINLGAGYKMGRHFSVLAEYQFINDKLPGSLIADAGAQGGHAHIWSLTLDPVIDLFPARKNDVYFTGGGGFYRKVTSFTDPEEVEQCYYFCEIGVVDVVVSHFSSNQGGANIGIGFTHKVGGDEHLKAFAEARYLWINTPPIGETDGLGRTELIPVTFGLRW